MIDIVDLVLCISSPAEWREMSGATAVVAALFAGFAGLLSIGMGIAMLMQESWSFMALFLICLGIAAFASIAVGATVRQRHNREPT